MVNRMFMPLMVILALFMATTDSTEGVVECTSETDASNQCIIDNYSADVVAMASACETETKDMYECLCNGSCGQLGYDFALCLLEENCDGDNEENAYTDCCTPVPGCTDSEATNYDSSATLDDGSCTYPAADCLGEPNGSAEVDDCGVCNGGNASKDQCGVCYGVDSCVGCMDTQAWNYDVIYTIDDNCLFTCESVGWACDVTDNNVDYARVEYLDKAAITDSTCCTSTDCTLPAASGDNYVYEDEKALTSCTSLNCSSPMFTGVACAAGFIGNVGASCTDDNPVAVLSGCEAITDCTLPAASSQAVQQYYVYNGQSLTNCTSADCSNPIVTGITCAGNVPDMMLHEAAQGKWECTADATEVTLSGCEDNYYVEPGCRCIAMNTTFDISDDIFVHPAGCYSQPGADVVGCYAEVVDQRCQSNFDFWSSEPQFYHAVCQKACEDDSDCIGNISGGRSCIFGFGTDGVDRKKCTSACKEYPQICPEWSTNIPQFNYKSCGINTVCLEDQCCDAECTLPAEAPAGYTISANATLDGCTVQNCYDPSFSGIECAEGFYHSQISGIRISCSIMAESGDATGQEITLLGCMPLNCENIDSRSHRDQNDKRCRDYKVNDQACGKFDTAHFIANDMCCNCGGGFYNTDVCEFNLAFGETQGEDEWYIWGEGLHEEPVCADNTNEVDCVAISYCLWTRAKDPESSSSLLFTVLITALFTVFAY